MIMKNNPGHPFRLLLVLAFHLVAVAATSQHRDAPLSESIAVMARPSADSVLLRWAPLNFKVWHLGNIHGYRIERYTLARNGSLLSQVEKVILHPSVKPLPEQVWEKWVANDPYAAVAAQALYGDRFELDLKGSDIFTVVNKVRENEQRFAFALFSADMSPDVARASGLWFADRRIKEGEKYLYRIAINAVDSLRGSLFISPDDPYALPEPQNLKGEFHEAIVSLKWNQSPPGYYTAYKLERSEDGKLFRSITEAPLVTASPTETADTRYEYAVDSLQDLSVTYHYRVKGITPFGEESPPSNVVSGKGTAPVSQVPYISAVENTKNISLLLRWDFPATNDHAIKGFAIERSSKPKGKFASLTENVLSPRERKFEDRHPGPVNYYRVTAVGLDGKLYPSHVYFAQLIDSIAPASPSQLMGRISEEGTVTLSWEPNREPDIYGYRVYKSNYKSEELAQITSEPIPHALFTDQVDLNTLNETAYYSVMAVDINQNHSPLSELLKVDLPDQVRPQPPVFHPVKNDGRISLSWAPAPSEDVVKYKVYRRTGNSIGWEEIGTVQALEDTLYHYHDESAVPGEQKHYTVIAVDDSGLESEPATPVTGNRIDLSLHPVIKWKQPRVNRAENQITLAWTYSQPAIQSFKIYRAVDHHHPVLFRTISGEHKEFTDTIIPGRHYAYRIMAFFQNGRKSLLSDEVEFQY